MPQKQSAFRNSVWNGIALAAQAVGAFAVMMIVARRFGPTSTGSYAWALWIPKFISSIVLMGIPTAIAKYLAEYRGKEDHAGASSILRRLLGFRLAILSVAFLVSALSVLAIHPAEYQNLLVGLLLLIFWTLREDFSSVLAGMERFRLSAQISVASAAVSIALVWAAYFYWRSVMGLIVAAVAASAIAIALYLMGFWDVLQQPAGTSPALPTRKLLQYSVSIALVSLVQMMIWQRTEIPFLRVWSTEAEIGYYSVAFGIACLLDNSTYIIGAVVLPMASRYFGRGDHEGLRALYARVMLAIQMLSLPLGLFAILVAHPLIVMIYGPEFAPASSPFAVLIGGFAIAPLAGTAAVFLYAVEGQSSLLKLWLPIGFLSLALGAWLCKEMGALGGAIGKSTAMLAVTIAAVSLVGRRLKTSFPWKRSMSVYGCIALGSLPLMAARWAHAGTPATAICLLIACAAYLSLLFAFGQIDTNIWRELQDDKVEPIVEGFPNA